MLKSHCFVLLFALSFIAASAAIWPAVTSAKIGAGAVGAAHLASGAVSANQLAENAVAGAKIAAGQVVKSLNGLTDAVTLEAGANVTITPAGSKLRIAADAQNEGATRASAKGEG